MPAALFQRMTGVPWDEFRVAWRLYNAQHGAKLRLLAFILVGAAILYGVVSAQLVFSAIDLDGAGSFFQSEDELIWRRFAGSSPLYLLAVAIPLVPLFIPSRLDEPIPGIQSSVQLSARLSAIAISLCIVSIFSCLQPLVLTHSIPHFGGGTRYLSLVDCLGAGLVLSLYLAVPIIMLQRFLQPGKSPHSAWYFLYSSWAVTYLLVTNGCWDYCTTAFQNQMWDYLVFSENPFLLLLAHLPLLALMRSRRLTMIIFPACCLNVLFFVFVYRHFTDYSSGAFYSGISQESIIAPVLQSIGWPLVGTYQLVITRIVDLIQ